MGPGPYLAVADLQVVGQLVAPAETCEVAVRNATGTLEKTDVTLGRTMYNQLIYGEILTDLLCLYIYI